MTAPVRQADLRLETHNVVAEDTRQEVLLVHASQAALECSDEASSQSEVDQVLALAVP